LFESVNRDDNPIVSLPHSGILVSEIAAQYVEVQTKAPIQLSLPVADQSCRADDQDPLSLVATGELANDHPGFDGLAQTDLVGNEEAATWPSDDVVSQQDLMR
jgi:hypothetical protein